MKNREERQQEYGSAYRVPTAEEAEQLSRGAVVDVANVDFSRATVHAIERQVAYHLGPPDLTYCGRLWYRGKPQSVTESEWSAMCARADFAHFDFRVQ